MMAEPGAGFDSRGLGLRAQKKLLGQISSKRVAMTLIDEPTGRLLDNTHKLLRLHRKDKKHADKVIKYIVKSLVKVGVLYRNDQFNREELAQIGRFQHRFHSLAMTFVTFHEVDFTYDLTFLRSLLEECRLLLRAIVERHLTEKSKTRMDLVFHTFQQPDLLDELFLRHSHKQVMTSIVGDLTRLLEEGVL